MKSCDVFVFPSKREGLSVALMEAIACGLPCVGSNIRGNNDLITNENVGYLVNLKGKQEWCSVIIKCLNIQNKNKIINKDILEFDIKNIEKKYANNIYV